MRTFYQNQIEYGILYFHLTFSYTCVFFIRISLEEHFPTEISVFMNLNKNPSGARIHNFCHQAKILLVCVIESGIGIGSDQSVWCQGVSDCFEWILMKESQTIFSFIIQGVFFNSLPLRFLLTRSIFVQNLKNKSDF